MSGPGDAADTQNPDRHAGAHASIGRLKRLAAEFETANPAIGLAEGRGAFEQLLLEILTAVGWRGEQRRLRHDDQDGLGAGIHHGEAHG